MSKAGEDKKIWTRSQELVINNKDDDMIVSASAGSGKTTVMIEHIATLIKNVEDASLADMVVCTFTKASAADMKGKLYSLFNRLAKEGGTVGEKFKRELSLLPQAQISTIHSFCAQLIRTFFYAVEVDPDFEIADETQTAVLLSESIEKTVDEFLGDANKDFMRLYELMLKKRKADKLCELIKKVYGFAECQDDFDKWLERCLAEADRHDEHLEYLNGKKFKEKIVDSSELLPLERVVVELTRAAKAKFDEAKRKKALLDYADLEHYAIEILSDPQMKDVVSRKYKYVFVDEYQDVNPLQERLISHIRAQKFFVGDVKQSIYAFRMCDPSIFRKKYDAYNVVGAVRQKAVDLSSNFRSDKRILQFCDEVFSDIMTEEFGQIDYKRNACFQPRESASFNPSAVEAGIAVIDCASEKAQAKPEIYSVKNHENADGETGLIEAEVKLVVDRIERLLAQCDDEGKPKNSPSDIAVLLRSMRGEYAKTLKRKLAERNIPSFVSDKIRADENPEVFTLVSAVKFIDNHDDDIALCAVMRSCLGGFTDDDIASIKEWDNATHFGGKERFFYDAVREYIAAVSGVDMKLREKLEKFWEKFDRYTLLSKTVKVSRLLGIICSENEFFRYVYSKRGGVSAASELAQFLDIAESDAYDGTPSEFIKRAESEMPELEAVPPAGAVKVMTVHASKGLEFKHVILGRVGKKFDKRDLWDRVLLDTDLGLSLKRFTSEKNDKAETSLHVRIKVEKEKKLKEEEMRILYVALTRAKETLYVCGAMKELPETVQAQDAESYIEWLYPHIREFAKIYFQDDIAALLPPRQVDVIGAFKSVDEALKNEIKRYIAPIEQKKKYPHKTTVTKAAREHEGEDETLAQAAFADNERGAEIGSAYHLLMQYADFAAPWKEERERLEKEFPEQCALVDMRSVEKACAEMGRLCTDKRIHRETPFIASFDAEDLYAGTEKTANTESKPNNTVKIESGPNTKKNQKILVQGIIDLLIEDRDGFVILDYKSGNVEGEHLNSYVKQVDLYAAAVEKLLKKKVTKKYLYSFSQGKLIKI